MQTGSTSPARPASGGWSPLLEGSRADQAWEVIQDVARRLADFLARARSAEPGPRDLVLSSGLAGIAIFHGYLFAATGDEQWRRLARECLEQAVAGIERASLGCYLLDGFAGIGWACSHLAPILADPADEEGGEDPVAAVDEVLLELVSATPWHSAFDLVMGLTGYGVFGLERLPRPAAAAIVGQVVRRLEETVQKVGSEAAPGFAWKTPPQHLSARKREAHPEGHFDLGVSHGQPGVIALLGQALCRGLGTPRMRRILDGAVDWLLAQELPTGGSSRFPWTFAEGLVPRPARTAWCYGDPGIALAVDVSARALGRPDWQARALAVGRSAARRAPEETGVTDFSLCHGAAGLGHMFNRLCQETGEAVFADAGRFWLRRSLAARLPERGFPGYEKLAPAEWLAEPGLLNGAAGVGLALLAGVSSCEPGWDRVLLMSSFPSP